MSAHTKRCSCPECQLKNIGETSYRDGFQEGRAVGFERGLQCGLERGRDEGFEAGYAEAVAMMRAVTSLITAAHHMDN